eukprot:TRINITY_DN6733_c0_g1_i1.p2 TRINITY_DN6733_c0_g1~~TRINITY_DN6733_c0_g1_i1.p2  ORF type:complete len:102 (-),score=15.47 TRINITY_DN6733_c0_g1_i1:111-416(-)
MSGESESVQDVVDELRKDGDDAAADFVDAGVSMTKWMLFGFCFCFCTLFLSWIPFCYYRSKASKAVERMAEHRSDTVAAQHKIQHPDTHHSRSSTPEPTEP